MMVFLTLVTVFLVRSDQCLSPADSDMRSCKMNLEPACCKHVLLLLLKINSSRNWPDRGQNHSNFFCKEMFKFVSETTTLIEGHITYKYLVFCVLRSLARKISMHFSNILALGPPAGHISNLYLVHDKGHV